MHRDKLEPKPKPNPNRKANMHRDKLEALARAQARKEREYASNAAGRCGAILMRMIKGLLCWWIHKHSQPSPGFQV